MGDLMGRRKCSQGLYSHGSLPAGPLQVAVFLHIWVLHSLPSPVERSQLCTTPCSFSTPTAL